MPMTKTQRATLAMQTAEVMQTVYEHEGTEGDFADAERYLRDDASDVELIDEHNKWMAEAEKLDGITGNEAN